MITSRSIRGANERRTPALNLTLTLLGGWRWNAKPERNGNETALALLIPRPSVLLDPWRQAASDPARNRKHHAGAGSRRPTRRYCRCTRGGIDTAVYGFVCIHVLVLVSLDLLSLQSYNFITIECHIDNIMYTCMTFDHISVTKSFLFIRQNRQIRLQCKA